MLLTVGILSLIFGFGMMFVYLKAEKGSILDPISISWMGYIACISVAMIGVAAQSPASLFGDVRGTSAALTVIGTICFTIGLYAGSGRHLKRLIPRPSPAFGIGQVYLIWLFSGAILIVTFTLIWKSMPREFISIIHGVVTGSLGALVLVSLAVLFTYRGHWGTKLIMSVTLIAGLIFCLQQFWSRRPLTGLFFSAAAFFYRTKLAHRSLTARVLVISGVFASSFLVMLYLGATRGQRFYGEKAGAQSAVLSSENLLGGLGGLTINYHMQELAVATYPEHRPYLYGSGYVPGLLFWIPRFIYPSKPISTGAVITRLYYATDNPTNNVALTAIGEAYVNFGWVGATLLMFLAGKIVRAMNTYMRDESHNAPVWLAWLMISPDFATEWRGDFASMTVQALMRVLIFLGIVWFSGKLLRQENDAWRLDLDAGYDPYDAYGYGDPQYESAEGPYEPVADAQR